MLALDKAAQEEITRGRPLTCNECGVALKPLHEDVRLLWRLFAGSAGASTRATVLFAIKEQPRNAQQLSQFLHLDYTTVRHHLRVMEANRIVVTEGGKYGKIYFVSELMELHWSKLQDIRDKRDATNE